MSTTFVQYKYCPLCRTSCKKLRKHVHSPKHQEIVKNILTKFLKKISEAKAHLENPNVHDPSWSETERKVWCYFCSCDVDRHLSKSTMEGDCVIVSAGFLGHITRKDHSENTAKFLKDNLVDMKRTSEFLLDNEVFLRFLEKAEKISVDYLTEKNLNLKKAAYSMRVEKAYRRHVMNQGLFEQKQRQQQSRTVDLKSTQDETRSYQPKSTSLKADQQEGERKKTERAYGDGLTVVERSNEDDSGGNVHSNAIPPWLKKDDTEDMDRDATIGPSMHDWSKHKKLEQKRKLPACRVGAKFDHKTSQGDEWLPNFGGIWSHGPRTKSSTHFKRRLNAQFQKQGTQSEIQQRNNSNSPGLISLPHSSGSSTDSSLPHSSTLDQHAHPVITNDRSSSFLHHQVESKYHSSLNNAYNFPVSSNILTQSEELVSRLENSDNYSLTLTLPPSTKTVKPYVSKRRKVGESVVSTSTTYSSTGNLEPFHPNGHFSSHHGSVSNYLHSPFPNFSGSGIEKEQIQDGNKNSTLVNSSSFRLLPTPVLTKKK